MKNASRQALRLLGMMLTAAALAVGGHAARAAPLQYPDLQNIIPPADMSIVQNGSVREFRYTHDIYNAGPGPLEIQPIYSNTYTNARLWVEGSLEQRGQCVAFLPIQLAIINSCQKKWLRALDAG